MGKRKINVRQFKEIKFIGSAHDKHDRKRLGTISIDISS
jgi:hypothetical protein